MLNVVGNLLHGLSVGLADWRQRNRAYAELAQLDDRALAAGGIDPGAVRFSIGLEDAEDLISDAYVALESLSRP